MKKTNKQKTGCAGAQVLSEALRPKQYRGHGLCLSSNPVVLCVIKHLKKSSTVRTCVDVIEEGKTFLTILASSTRLQLLSTPVFCVDVFVSQCLKPFFVLNLWLNLLSIILMKSFTILLLVFLECYNLSLMS